MNENFWVAIVLLTRIRSIQAGSRGTPDVGVDRAHGLFAHEIFGI